MYRELLEGALQRVLASGRFVLEEEVERFEREFASHCGAAHAVGVASGTDAITIALQALEVGPGDEVVTAANTCVPTVVGIERAGAVPVLVDADRESFTLDPARLHEAMTPRTRAIVPVHLHGCCADMEPILAFAREHGLSVVEDCAQAHGAEYGGRRAGSLGDAAAFSFYPTKNLGALGDGGAVVTADADIAERARLLRNYGETERFRHVLRGHNSRLDAIQAAVLAAQLPLLEDWNARRQAIAAAYTEALAGTSVRAPALPQWMAHVYHHYVVLAEDREAFRQALADRGVGTAVHYPYPVHLQPAYRELAPRDRRLTVSERLAATSVSLPLYPELDDSEVAYVAETLAVVSR